MSVVLALLRLHRAMHMQYMAASNTVLLYLD